MKKGGGVSAYFGSAHCFCDQCDGLVEPFIARLEQLRQTINRHVARSNTTRGRRSLILIDKYSELKAEAGKAGVWEGFCAKYGYDPRHAGHDLFA